MKGFCVLVNIWSLGFLNFRSPNQQVQKGSSEGPTHQKKLLPNQVLKKELNIKGQLTKKATSQPATKKRAKYKGPTHKKSFFTTIYLKKLVLT